MTTSIRKILALLLLFGTLFPHAVVIAYDVSQIGQTATQVNQAANQVEGLFSQYTGLQLADVLEDSGLKGAKAKICIAKNILGQVESITSNITGVLTAELSRALTEAFQVIFKDLAICALAAIPYVGDAFPKCNIKTAGNDVEQNLRKQALDFKQRFVGGCVAAAQLNDMMAFAKRVSNEWGPDGSPVYVTNWVNDIFTEPDRRALRRMWTLLVNTDICPQFERSVWDYFGVPDSYREAPPPIASNELAVNADTSFPERMRCTMPADYNPRAQNTTASFAANGGYLVYEREGEPQNNYDDFIMLAEAELGRQRATTVQAAIAEATSGGGFRSIYGNAAQSCRIRDANGNCIEFTEALQPPANAAVIGALPITVPVELALAQAPGPEDEPINDTMAIFANHVMGMLNQPLPFRIQFGFSNDPKTVLTPVPTTTPSTADLQCTEGDTRCTAVCDDPIYQQAASVGVGPAMVSVQQSRPELFDPPGSGRIATGVTYRTVGQAVCDAMNQEQPTCQLHPSRDDQIVLLAGGQSISVSIITSDGGLRQGGGQAVAVCPTGVQD